MVDLLFQLQLSFEVSVFKMPHNEQVLLQVGDFITSSPELLLGFVKLLMLRTIAWRYSSAETEVDRCT